MKELLTQVESLQNLLVSRATGNQESNAEFTRLRQIILENTELDVLIPKFIKTCRNIDQFWQFIKYEFGSYQERRDFIWNEFCPFLDAIERGGSAPSDEFVTKGLGKIDAAHVKLHG